MTPLEQTPTPVVGRVDTGPPPLPEFHVIVDFGCGVPLAAQGVVLLAMEKSLRGMGLPAEVFKRTAPDDSKLRRFMTKAQREKL